MQNKTQGLKTHHGSKGDCHLLLGGDKAQLEGQEEHDHTREPFQQAEMPPFSPAGGKGKSKRPCW